MRISSLVGALFLVGAAVLSMQTLTLDDGTSCGTWLGYKSDEHDRFVATAKVRRQLADSFRERGEYADADRSERAANKLDSADFACGNQVNERSFFVAVLGLVGGAVLIGSRMDL